MPSRGSSSMRKVELFWRTIACRIRASSHFARKCWSAFRDDPKVGSISGTTFCRAHYAWTEPYGFFQVCPDLGLGNLAPVWQHYDFELTGEEAEWESIIRRVNPIETRAKYWLQIFQALRSGLIDTWDYQVMFSAWKADLVHIFPSGI